MALRHGPGEFLHPIYTWFTPAMISHDMAPVLPDGVVRRVAEGLLVAEPVARELLV